MRKGLVMKGERIIMLKGLQKMRKIKCHNRIIEIIRPFVLLAKYKIQAMLSTIKDFIEDFWCKIHFILKEISVLSNKVNYHRKSSLTRLWHKHPILFPLIALQSFFLNKMQLHCPHYNLRIVPLAIKVSS